MSARSQRRHQENRLVFAVFLLYFLMAESTRNCPQSNMTFQYVDRCPGTRKEWMDAALRKNCSGIKQNCAESENFQHHCVINSLMNANIEVCAPTWFCIGFCAEYNLQGERIQDNFNAPCRTFSNPCPPRYLSSEAYLYQGCYRLVETQKKESLLHNKRTYDVASNDKETVITVSVLCHIAVLLSALAVVFYKRKHEKRSKPPKIDNEEIKDDERMIAETHNI
ncbi:uncharacterized protein LOC133176859 [Saccostrea echinata]|uniref:uncharacterized protein LOC133176859 n=1 Tax=Saccostrea echinata TaxID=191078 RepID=UPI002A812A83|nr:uncharacterized protein LOC133176859 [Saccostrea echinata]